MTENKNLSIEEIEARLQEIAAEEKKMQINEAALVNNTAVTEEETKEAKKEEKKVETDLKDYLVLSDSFYAGFWLRLAAYLIDSFVATALGTLLNTITFGFLDLGYDIPGLDKALPVAIAYFLYFVLMTYILGQTLGKMIVGIRVETNAGEKLAFSDVLFREIVGRIINSLILMLPYLVVAFTPKKKGIHDHIADTVVVKEKYSNIRRKLNTQFFEGR